jgi:diguanylate cyclase (GGDEF)-like protein/PAS domain S-box-containing protein
VDDLPDVRLEHTRGRGETPDLEHLLSDDFTDQQSLVVAALLQDVGLGFIVVDRSSGQVIRLSPWLSAFPGLDLGSLLALPLAARQDPQLEMLHLDIQAAREGRSSTSEMQLIDRDGKLWWVQCATRPLGDQRILATVHDLTRSRNAEVALSEAWETVLLVVDQDPLARIVLGEDGFYRDANLAMCRVTGYTKQQLLRMTPAELTYPADFALAHKATTRLLKGKTNGYTRDKRYRMADGQPVWVSESASLWRSADGLQTDVVLQAQDIDARKQHEWALAEERRRLSDAHTVGRLGSWELDLGSDSVIWSDMIFELYGLERLGFGSDLQSALDCVHPDDRALVGAAIARCAETGQPMEVHYRVTRRNDGAPRSIIARGQRLQQEDGALRLVGTACDVTEMVEQVRAEAESQIAYQFQEAVLGATPDTMFVYDVPSHSSVWTNRATTQLVGFRDSDLSAPQNDSIETLISDATRSDFDEALAATCDAHDGEVVQLDYQLAHSDGTLHWFSQRTTPLYRDTDGLVVQLSGALRDTTDLHIASRALADSEQRFRLAFDTAPLGMALIDLAELGRLLHVNPALCALAGRSESELLEHSLQALVHPEDSGLMETMLEHLTNPERTPMHAEMRLSSAERVVVWTQLTMSVVSDIDGRPLHGICLMADVTARRHAERELLHFGMHDPLTGLPNRNLLRDRLGHALLASERSGRSVGVIYIDLDGFKRVNDTSGHAAGDELLVLAAARLESAVRPGDTVGRLGGDEFGIICVNVDDLAGLSVAASRLLVVLDEPFRLTSGSQHISGSIGLSLSEHASNADQLLADADAAMYSAKNAGKNRIALPNLADRARAARMARLTPELRVALDEDQILMHGQPVLDLTTGHPVAVETLVRWRHPVLGLLPPSEFLDVAEQTPLILAIGQRALSESCRMAAEWYEQLGAAAPDLHVNVSGRQLESGNLSEDVVMVLGTYGFPASRLVLELTETHMPSLTDSLLYDIALLRDLGVRIAIDDIGTGYSSLSRLTELPVDILKIDLRFIAGLGREPACQAIVRAVLSLGQEMGLSVIAEGVETLDQAEMLAGYGCDTVQGFLYSPPRPQAELLRYLVDARAPSVITL